MKYCQKLTADPRRRQNEPQRWWLFMPKLVKELVFNEKDLNYPIFFSSLCVQKTHLLSIEATKNKWFNF